jgi:hypothetical protein
MLKKKPDSGMGRMVKEEPLTSFQVQQTIP